MHGTPPNGKPAPRASGARIIGLALGFAILAIVLLPPVKAWLNQIPYLWQVLYPLFTLFAGYLVVTAILARESAVMVIKWLLLLLATGGAALFALGGLRIGFSLGRVSAMLFIVIEVIHTVIDVKRDRDAQRRPSENT